MGGYASSCLSGGLRGTGLCKFRLLDARPFLGNATECRIEESEVPAPPAARTLPNASLLQARGTLPFESLADAAWALGSGWTAPRLTATLEVTPTSGMLARFGASEAPVGDNSAIEWTDATWNPVTGCSKVSPGCAYCYAETLSRRFGTTGRPWTRANAAENVALHRERLQMPLRWRRPRMVFVNSMSDLFHELVPTSFVGEVWATMAAAPQHTFQILTKRPERMPAIVGEMAETHGVLNNVWLGTSIESNRWVHRAAWLRETPAAIRFVSAEPLLGGLDALDLAAIDWLIVGGESNGPPRRALVASANGHAMQPKEEALAWVRELRDRCQHEGVAFFLKQWGGRTPKIGGRDLDGRRWDEVPARVTTETEQSRPSMTPSALGAQRQSDPPPPVERVSAS